MQSNVTWLMPWVLWLLPLPIIVYVGLPASKPSRDRALRVPDLTPYEALIPQHKARNTQNLLRAVLLTLAWATLLAATARPQSFGEPIGVPVTGRDLMLGIDISGSMREADIYAGNRRATRMAVVKQVAKDFVSRRTGDRVGLIMFGSQAYVQTPLTHDHETVQHFLNEAVVGLAGRSTAIGDAIGLAVKRLRDRPDTSRVLVLLTDGENSAGVIEPVAAARLAATSGIRIHTIGVGADPRGGVFNVPFGNRRSELDETTLRAISDETGGQYFRARNQQELASIYREIDRLEPTELDIDEFRPLRELFVWPLSASLLLTLLWAAIGLVSVSPRNDRGTS